MRPDVETPQEFTVRRSWNRGWLRSVPLLVAMALGLTACGGDPPAVCDDADALRSSLSDLKGVDLGAGAAGRIEDQLDVVEADVEQLKKDAADEYSTQVDALSSAVDSLKTAATSAQSDPTAESVTALAGGVEAVGTAVTDLSDAVESTC